MMTPTNRFSALVTMEEEVKGGEWSVIESDLKDTCTYSVSVKRRALIGPAEVSIVASSPSLDRTCPCNTISSVPRMSAKVTSNRENRSNNP